MTVQNVIERAAALSSRTIDVNRAISILSVLCDTELTENSVLDDGDTYAWGLAGYYFLESCPEQSKAWREEFLRRKAQSRVISEDIVNLYGSIDVRR